MSDGTTCRHGFWQVYCFLGSGREEQSLGEAEGNKRMVIDEQERTAYHEAGHVVMAIQLGATIVRASIEPADDGPHRFGETITHWPPQSDRQMGSAALCVSLGGPVAEMIYTGEVSELSEISEWRVDRGQAIKAASQLARHRDELPQLITGATASVREFLESDNGWAAVAAISDLLLTHDTVEHVQCLEAVGFWLGGGGEGG